MLRLYGHFILLATLNRLAGPATPPANAEPDGDDVLSMASVNRTAHSD
jgi:hypothetical protein